MDSRDVETLFNENQEREQALRTMLKTRPSESRDVQALRSEIKAAYSDILGMDPEFCASKDVELLLWKNCYYKRIEDFRKRLRKYAHLSSSLERAKAFEAREHLHGICQAFARFLGEATEFYSSLLRRFEAMHHQYSKGISSSDSDGGRSSNNGSSNNGSSNNGSSISSVNNGSNGSGGKKARLLKLVVYSINRCLIFLGDLARYRELHGENSAKDWSSAERFYHQALAVLPTSGNPHNQLAVLATYTDAECVAVYRYCRSLMIESPFQTAHENLTLLFEKNKQKGFGPPGGAGKEGMGPGGPNASSRDMGAMGSGMNALAVPNAQHHPKGKGKGSGGRGNTGALLKSFLRRFVRLHGMIFSGRQEDLEDFPSIFETAIADFRTLLTNSAFGDALLLKMVVICIFSVTHVAESKGPPPSALSAGGNASESSREAFRSGEGDNASEGSGTENSERNTSTSGGAGAATSESDSAAASKAEEVRRNARLTYPLALAFGVSAQIGRHVRTQEPTHPSQGSQHHGGHGHGRGYHRHGNNSHGGSVGGDTNLLHGHGSGQGTAHSSHGHHGHHASPPQPVVVYGVDSKSRPSSNQPQPRPLGSRLLGPVVLFCDWLTAQHRFLRSAEEERSNSSGGSGGGRSSSLGRGRAVASVAVQEAEMRAQFWEVVLRLSATLPDQDSNNQPDVIPGDARGRRRPLKEHVELRGFLPLAELYKKQYAMDGHAVAAVPDDCAGSVRIRGLKAFAAGVSGEPFAPVAAPMNYPSEGILAGGQSDYAWSDGGSSHLSHDPRAFELQQRHQQPRSQFGRAPHGMGSGSSIASGSERMSRSGSGAGAISSRNFGSGSSIGGGSDHSGRRSSRGMTGGQSMAHHSRNASMGNMRMNQAQQMTGEGPLSRHGSQSMMPQMMGSGTVNTASMEFNSTGETSASYTHPPLPRASSQAGGVLGASSSASSSRMYGSRNLDAGGVGGGGGGGGGGGSGHASRHSLDSGIRYYEAGGGSRHGGGSGSNCSGPTNVQSMASNSGSGSGSSGLGSALSSAHDNRSWGAWNAPTGRSGGSVGNSTGGGGGWAAEQESRNNARLERSGGDDEYMMIMQPPFAPRGRRSTGGGGGPVAIGSSRGEDGGSGSAGGGLGAGGGGGSDLGSAGSPQFGSGGASSFLGGGLWTGSFSAQDLALSPQAPSDYAEDGEKYNAEHSLFGSSWKGAIGSKGAKGSLGTPMPNPLDASVGSPTLMPSSPNRFSGNNGKSGSGGSGGSGGSNSLTAYAATDSTSSSSLRAPMHSVGGGSDHSGGGGGGGMGAYSGGNGMDRLGQVSAQQPHDHHRRQSFDYRVSNEGGGLGYINHPFLPGQPQQPQQSQHQQQQHQNYPPGYNQQTRLPHRRQASTGSVLSARSAPPTTIDHRHIGEPPGFSDFKPGSPTFSAPPGRGSDGIGGGGGGGSGPMSVSGGIVGDVSCRETSPLQASDHRRRSSYSGPLGTGSGVGGQRSHHASPPYPHGSGQGHGSPPQLPSRHHRHFHDQQGYRRRSSSPATSTGGVRDEYSGGGSPIPLHAHAKQTSQQQQQQRQPASSLPHAFGGSATGNPSGHDDTSSIFSSNMSATSSYSGFSGFSAYTTFGGSDLSTGGGGGGSGAVGGGTSVGSSALSWRHPAHRGDSGNLPTTDEGGPSRRGGQSSMYGSSHSSGGGAVGCGAVMESAAERGDDVSEA